MLTPFTGMISAVIEPSHNPRLLAIFSQVMRVRWWIVAFYAGLVPGALILALRIPEENAIERMVVASNPDVAATREFQQIFSEKPIALLVVDTSAPFSAEAIAGVQSLQAAVDQVPHVTTYSVLTVWERMRPGAASRAGAPAALEHFVSGTPFFRDQGLIGDDFFGVVVALDVAGPDERDAALAGIDQAIAEVTATPQGRAGFREVRRVGRPWLDAWLEHETRAATARYFPLFGAFVIVLTIALYRSFRALLTILLSLGVAVLLGVAFGGLVGFGFTIVSALVPLILMITATASLVYLHSRFVDQAPGTSIDDHRIRALSNKFLAVSASMFAAGVGFAALAVSDIRPVRQLGVWTSVGLAGGWLVCFTLYPALQVILGAPTRRERAVAGGFMTRVAEAMPHWSYRWRWGALAVAALLAAAGLAALAGVPGVLQPMRLQTDALDYVDPNVPVARDTRAFTATVVGLTSVSVWITTPAGGVLDPSLLAGLDRLSGILRRDPAVGSVVGLPAVLRLRRYTAGQGDALPEEPGELARLTGDLEQLLLTEPAIGQWVDKSSLSATYLTVSSRAGDSGGFPGLERAVAAAWRQAAAASPALAACSYRIVGTGVLQYRIAADLVPTLTQSFAITFGIIFVTFLLVFRSGPARLIAMVPSLVAILVMFLLMRLTGIQLNVATILIATVVLGATENDQIHFFYHFQERRAGGTTEEAMAHSVRIAGHAILFATVINAGGFLALILSNLPPMRQFGTVTSAAFVFAMAADFTALPAALWVFFRERPRPRE
jgi:predicted RND superfamily exporter protein